jgi:hypothetical protein
MIFARILTLIKAYSLWLYAAGFLALLLSLHELRQAQKLRAATIFTLEKELAAVRERRGRTTFIVALSLLILLTVLIFVVLPAQPLPPVQEPSPTPPLLELPTSTPVTPTPTRTRIPTRPRPTPLPPTATPGSTEPPPPPACAQPGIRITSPSMNQVVSGQVTIRGTAQMDQFQFYKLEYGLGENPQQWHSTGDVHRSPVVDNVLGTWDTAGFPNGVCKLRLTVVDVTGNFPPPCEVRVVIQQ